MIDHINSTVFCTLAPSSIHGIGVFAIRDISKGTKLTDYYWGSERKLYSLSVTDFYLLLPEVRKLILDRIINRDEETFYFFSPNSEQVLQSFMNHSTNANSDGIIALRDIKKGEEITENYSLLISNPSKANLNNFNYL